MKNNKLNKNQTFLGIFTVQPNGALKVEKAQRLTGINQHKSRWTKISARNFARGINNASLVIK